VDQAEPSLNASLNHQNAIMAGTRSAHSNGSIHSRSELTWEVPVYAGKAHTALPRNPTGLGCITNLFEIWIGCMSVVYCQITRIPSPPDLCICMESVLACAG
jgi:hypothetical protein